METWRMRRIKFRFQQKQIITRMLIERKPVKIHGTLSPADIGVGNHWQGIEGHGWPTKFLPLKLPKIEIESHRPVKPLQKISSLRPCPVSDVSGRIWDQYGILVFLVYLSSALNLLKTAIFRQRLKHSTTRGLILRSKFACGGTRPFGAFLC